ncbi:hypothetical protein [Hellea balneolensis]|uniref:hypothetical protein n=1 Tax=Hellea balneolensis TaxID=287478 RepID=UPI00040F6430|nr:hypothetical protein [Hellea balneolensis]
MVMAEPHICDERLDYRPANVVMDINRLGTLYPYPLSFMRSLVRRILREKWDIKRSHIDLCNEGYGEVIYSITTPNDLFSYVVFSKNLDPNIRSDRVIAEDWDMTVTLCQGEVDAERLDFLRQNVPLQEKGRMDSRCIVLSRANKSARNFNYVVDRLSSGLQPDLDVMAKVGYLYRTTAVYGSGKFGMADWDKVKTQYPDFASPFAAEMFSCFLIRDFSLFQADRVAANRTADKAVKMTDAIRRYVGIGNATGLGMAPYLINHPLLVNNWIEVRETALARIQRDGAICDVKRGDFLCLAQKAMQHLDEISTDNADQNTINSKAKADMSILVDWFEDVQISAWYQLTEYAESHLSVEAQELLNVLLLELYPDLMTDLEDSLSLDEVYALQADMPVGDLKALIETHYDWALNIDYTDPKTQGIFWYRSEEKMEPRLGQRFEEPGAANEMLLGIGWYVCESYRDLCTFIEDRGRETTTARFVFENPQHRYITRRMQTMAKTRYGEIRINAIDLDVLPIHLLRCKLSFFGVGKFDPRSRMWVRNTMFQGAPLISDIGESTADTWCFPIRPAVSG